ncbi:hypothetical protein RJ640_013035 [Escallonia rubra]|uniref:Integrase zinc-binding domain-containing protein n=1 Tax=Escallonia rubra TaxID=112253 RepID=A0AA88RRH0_9ASTE|nr:hypothetical protein RJ640_013035 [Escallonia rubra]
MDDFKLILGLEFLRDTKTTVMPCTNSMAMLGSKSCVIPTISPRAGECSISALQLKKGLKRDETTYLAMLRWDEIEEVSGPLPKEVKVILNDFEDARWQELLAEFNFMLKYRVCSTNSVADALSRRAELDQVALMAMNAIVRADSRVAINIGKKIRKALTRDLVAQQLLKLIESGKTRQFWQEDGLLMTKGRRGYYWPQMGDEVQEYVKTCLTCQYDNVERKKKAWLLQPLSVPKRPWESVSLDFITGLPKVEDLGTILVVVDRFSKYASFIITPKYCSAEETS